MMTIRACGEADLPAILAIHNHYIAHSTVIFRDETVPLSERQDWFRARTAQGFPVLVGVSGDEVAGYASYGEFRYGSGYRDTVEHSVYVHPNHHGKGIGRALMRRLITLAQAQDLHVMVAGIGLPNDASIRLHHSLGFIETGRMPEVGVKGGRRLGLCLMQLML